jgi:hypothetical protein
MNWVAETLLLLDLAQQQVLSLATEWAGAIKKDGNSICYEVLG